MNYETAIKLVLELAESGALSEREASESPELGAEMRRQEDAVKIVRNAATAKSIKLAYVGAQLAYEDWQGLPESLTELIISSRRIQGWRGKKLQQ